MKKLLVVCLSALLLGVSAVVMAAPVDINAADAPALALAMKGVGTKKAQAIVLYRKAHGPFRSIDDLVRVKGISKKTVARNRKELMVGKGR